MPKRPRGTNLSYDFGTPQQTRKYLRLSETPDSQWSTKAVQNDTKKMGDTRSYKGKRKTFYYDHPKPKHFSMTDINNKMLKAMYPILDWTRRQFNSDEINSITGYQGIACAGTASVTTTTVTGSLSVLDAAVARMWTRAELMTIATKLYTDVNNVTETGTDALANTTSNTGTFHLNYTGIHCLGGTRTYRLMNTSNAIVKGVLYWVTPRKANTGYSGSLTQAWENDLGTDDLLDDVNAPRMATFQQYQDLIITPGRRPDESHNKNVNSMYRFLEKVAFALAPGEVINIPLRVEPVYISNTKLKSNATGGILNVTNPNEFEHLPGLTREIVIVWHGQTAYDNTAGDNCYTGPAAVSMNLSVHEKLRWRASFRGKNYFRITSLCDLDNLPGSQANMNQAVYPLLADPKILLNANDVVNEATPTDNDA